MSLCDGKASISAAILDYCENGYIFLKNYFKGITLVPNVFLFIDSWNGCTA